MPYSIGSMKEPEQDSFEKHRKMLEGLAYRMCGTWADAQDIVQETHLKWHAAEKTTIENPRAWLVTVCSRLAMDTLKSARVRREQYVGTWLPEPLVMHEDEVTPDRQAQIDDSVSIALMFAMERLSPFERATFLLHDVFGYDFAQVAAILGKSESACRKSASRGRKAVQAGRPRFQSDAKTHQQLLGAFLEAVHDGEPDKLKTLLAASVELHADSGGRVTTAPAGLTGADAVAAFFITVWRENISSPERVHMATRWFNGQPGMLILLDGQPLVALSLAVEDDRISRIFALRNPEKLAALLVAD